MSFLEYVWMILKEFLVFNSSFLALIAASVAVSAVIVRVQNHVITTLLVIFIAGMVVTWIRFILWHIAHEFFADS